MLGRGACGSVVAVKHRQTGELFAMKVVSLETVGGTLEELKREIDIQATLDHPNICKIVESFEDPRRGIMYIVMELCTGGAEDAGDAVAKSATQGLPVRWPVPWC